VDVPGIERVAGWEESLLAFCRVAGELATARRMLAPDRFVEALRTSLLLEVSEAARSLGAFRSANLDRFFRDLRRALADCEGDVAGVLASLRHAVSDRREQQEGQPRAVEQAVRVMTMHGAKGLQFSHVYLAQLDKRSPAERRSEVSVVRGRGQVALRVFGQATLEYPALAIDRRRVESAERVRTLYVAMTRARERIVLVGRPQARDGTHAALLAARAGGVPGAEEIAACRQGFVDRAGARFVLPGLDPSSASRRRSSPAPETTRADLDHEAARVEARRHAAGRRAARPLSRPASSAGHDPAEGSVAAHELAEESAATRYGADGARTAGDVPASSERPSPAASREEAKAIGIAIHSALEHAELGAAGAGPSPRAARSALERALAQWAGAALSAGARAGANDLLDALIAGPLWRRLGAIAPHVVARELPVLVDPERLAPSDPLRIATGYDAPADDPTGFWSGAIDLLYADPESGEWVVADYKTDAVEGEGLRERARAYARQGAVYTRAVQTALRLPAPPRFELWFLRVGQVVPVPGAEGPTT
jgi:ATP-dependent exoDNAse (exonuclease V) beta subunit